jgi:hypothetical protein
LHRLGAQAGAEIENLRGVRLRGGEQLGQQGQQGAGGFGAGRILRGKLTMGDEFFNGGVPANGSDEEAGDLMGN